MLIWLFMVMPEPLSAKEFVVTTTEDAGKGSLRQAIQDANDHQGADQIIFDIPISDCRYLPSEIIGQGGESFFLILLSSPLPTVIEALIIDGKSPRGKLSSQSDNTMSENGLSPGIILCHQEWNQPLQQGFPEGVNLESHAKMGAQLIIADHQSMILAATLLIKDIRLISISDSHYISSDQ